MLQILINVYCEHQQQLCTVVSHYKKVVIVKSVMNTVGIMVVKIEQY